MPNLFESEKMCCGCFACADACPKKAITMTLKNGFLYPEIDSEMCVECGLCETVCAFKKPKADAANCIEAFAVKAQESVRMASSSGGAFTLLSDYVLEKGGTVYGAAYDEAMCVRHKRAETETDRDKMRGSKYIQSNLSGVYKFVKEDLNAGKTVLFTGIPCQVGALKSFLGKPYENLITVDLICHGVPSIEVWQKFVEFINKKYGRTMTDYAFRDKSVSWRSYSPKVTFSDGTTVGANNATGSYIELFRYDVALRPSCTQCPYASAHREGDFTMGDFWGIENAFPKLDDRKGVSALLVNSEKAAEILGAIQDKAEFQPCRAEQITAGQPNMVRPSQMSVKAAAFRKDFETLPFEKVLKKYTQVGLKRRGIGLAKRFLKK